MIGALIERISAGEPFTESEAVSSLGAILDGGIDAEEISRFLTALREYKLRGEELRGFRQALLDRAIAVDIGTSDLLDIVGTGGDGKGSFNISTLAALVAAGAGIAVAKHGNYSASSHTGASNVLEALGVKFSNDAEKLKLSLAKAGIAYLHAPLFHPALKAMAPIRKSLGFRTIFNLLGPLANPARPTCKLLGVASAELIELYREVLLHDQGCFTIVHSLDGYDELSLTGDAELADNGTRRRVSPTDLGFNIISSEELTGGNNIAEAKEIFINILEGRGTAAQNEVVIANAALALQTAGNGATFQESVERARDSLQSKAALKALNLLIEVTRSV